MVTRNTLKNMSETVRCPAARIQCCWSAIKIQRLLDDVGVFDYEIISDDRLVNVRSRGDLVRIMLHLISHKVSSEWSLTLTKIGTKFSMRFASWRFEADYARLYHMV